MTEACTRPARSLKQALGRQLPERRDDSGLTTLEWLLIVAAVAGLAALAVVLVGQVVTDTSENIAGQSARLTAAELAADTITETAERVAATSVDTADEWTTQSLSFARQCERLQITYGDVDSITSVDWNQEDPVTPMTDPAATGAAWIESIDADTPGTDDGCQVTSS